MCVNVYFQAQTLASLKAWCPWLTHLHTLSLKDESYLPQCRDLTLRIMVAVAPVVKAGDALELTHSAAHFMVTLTGNWSIEFCSFKPISFYLVAFLFQALCVPHRFGS